MKGLRGWSKIINNNNKNPIRQLHMILYKNKLLFSFLQNSFMLLWRGIRYPSLAYRLQHKLAWVSESTTLLTVTVVHLQRESRWEELTGQVFVVEESGRQNSVKVGNSCDVQTPN